MKFTPHVIAGIALIIYSIVLTPAFYEPSDFITTPLLITLAYTTYGDFAHVIVPLWIASGYLALVWGVVLVGRSAPFLKHMYAKSVLLTHHPVKVTMVVFGISVVISLLLLYLTGNL